jgi:AcrR family transcriptional regulator
MNVVHTLNVVQSSRARHLSLVPADRRSRRRDQRRRRILDAADSLIAEHGIDGITMQRVADHLDCAVGTLYLYFRSKGELVAALQAQAVDTLRASYDTARPGWDAYLDEAGLNPVARALVDVSTFAAHWVSASVVLADEFRLQRALLSEPALPDAGGPGDTRAVLDALLATPTRLVAMAVDTGALVAGGERDRALRWIAALNGVLLLDHLVPVDAHLFRAAHLARALSEDLLCGWGATRAEVEVADVHVQRLAALAPLAPPPSPPSSPAPAGGPARGMVP